MVPIIITVVLTIAGIITASILLKKYIKTDRAKNIALIVLSVGTVLVHYSSIIYHWIGHAIDPDQIRSVYRFLCSSPNLLMPIYPCNVVMIMCVINAFIKDKKSRVFEFFSDFIFVFGIVAAIVGLIANGDYFSGYAPDYDVLKSAVAHGFMLTNIIAISLFGYFKVDTPRNMVNVIIGLGVVSLDALYCNLVIYVFSGYNTMINWNAMFLFRSPIGGVSFLTYYYLAPLFILVAFIVLSLYELIAYKKEDRYWNKLKKKA